MMFGQILSRLSEMPEDEIVAGFGGDLVQLARLRNAAEAQEKPLATYIRDAIHRFLDDASEEEWTTAIGRMQSDASPGDQLIALALERQLRRDGM